MTTLLRYDATTDPLPLHASPPPGGPAVATLTVVATNPSPTTPATLQGVAVTLPVGTNASDLTTQAASIAGSAPAGWILSAMRPTAGRVEFVFRPQQQGSADVAGQALVFVLSNIIVNQQPGTVSVVIKEGSKGSPVQTLPLTKFPNP